jgi:hypothetical protein
VLREWDDPSLPIGGGLDQPFLATLFASMRNGAYGSASNLGAGFFNPGKIIASGYSSGAQMASWMIELQARRGLPEGVRVVAAAMVSGGSHLCYMNPPESVTQCANCSTTGACAAQSVQIPPFTCSADLAAEGRQVCCSYCCPTNTTELYYLENPSKYADHPPVFLAQSQQSDGNADLCAGRSYHATLLAHGVKTAIELIDARFARSYCAGSADDPAAAGSPFRGKTDSLPAPKPAMDFFFPEGCVDHTLGFAAMVEPLTAFMVDVLAGQ